MHSLMDVDLGIASRFRGAYNLLCVRPPTKSQRGEVKSLRQECHICGCSSSSGRSQRALQYHMCGDTIQILSIKIIVDKRNIGF